MIEAWLPTAACLGAVGFIWWYWKIDKTRTEKRYDDLVIERKRLMEVYLTEAKHSLLCDNNTLRLQHHTSDETEKVKKEIADLKDQMFSKFRELENLIRANGKGGSK